MNGAWIGMRDGLWGAAGKGCSGRFTFYFLGFSLGKGLSIAITHFESKFILPN